MNNKTRSKDTAVISWLREVSRKEKSYLFCLVFLNAIIAVCSVGAALLLRGLINDAVGGRQNGFIQNAAILLAIVTGQLVLRASFRYWEEYAKAELEKVLRGRMLHTILKREYACLSRYHSGDLMLRITSDISVVCDGMIALLPALVLMIARLLGALVCMLYIDWHLTVLFAVYGGVAAAAGYYFRDRMKNLHRAVQEKDGIVRSFLQEVMESLLIIKCFQAESIIDSKAAGFMEDHRKTRIKRSCMAVLSQLGGGLGINLGYFLGMIWCGWQILMGVLNLGTLVAVQQLIGQIQQPFTNMPGALSRYYGLIASAERLMELEEIPAEGLAIEEDEINKLCRGFYRIRMDDITFSYETEGGNILEHTSFGIERGDYIAIAGDSGIGKSTLLKLLLSVYENYTGEILIDSCGCLPVRMNAGYRKLFAYVPQGSRLMSGTIAEAVSFMEMKGTDTSGKWGERYEGYRMGRIKEACKLACADTFINELQDGYDTVLGERGIGLSEGQLQRLAIARAIYSGAPVLLMDEATSALDEVTEERLLRNLRCLKDRTVIIITHRKSVFSICNKIVWLENKKLRCEEIGAKRGDKRIL
ncbi:ATP-binding cassette subfamily B protein [Anaerotaenia torta]|uniref:ABC transporter ATP-binding protein n=1 Tax=Anaerotaenia torta TaxID=433293 RepID=UPI003D1FAEF2